jgi:hypothetical protein
MSGNYYDTDRMAEIVLSLLKFGGDSLIKYLLDRLFRRESDYLPLVYKSTGVLALEEKYNVSIAGKSRKQIYAIEELKGKVIIEHGLPQSQAIEMCYNCDSKNEIKSILEKLKNNLVLITKEEDKKLNKNKGKRSPKGLSDLYWKELYEKCDIEVVENPLPHFCAFPNGNNTKKKDEYILAKKQAMILINEKHNLHLNNSNTMFSSINQNVDQWSFNRKNFLFNDDTHMILINQYTKELHYFFIEKRTIKSPKTIFDQRNDNHIRDSSIIRILVSSYNFKEENSGFPFGDYKIDTFTY